MFTAPQNLQKDHWNIFEPKDAATICWCHRFCAIHYNKHGLFTFKCDMRGTYFLHDSIYLVVWNILYLITQDIFNYLITSCAAFSG